MAEVVTVTQEAEAARNMALDDKTGMNRGAAERSMTKAAPSSAGRTSPGEFIRQVRSETSKVVWPTREETVRTAIFVGILVLILSVFFLGIDSLFGLVVRMLLSLL